MKKKFPNSDNFEFKNETPYEFSTNLNYLKYLQNKPVAK